CPRVQQALDPLPRGELSLGVHLGHAGRTSTGTQRLGERAVFLREPTKASNFRRRHAALTCARSRATTPGCRRSSHPWPFPDRRGAPSPAPPRRPCPPRG